MGPCTDRWIGGCTEEKTGTMGHYIQQSNFCFIFSHQLDKSDHYEFRISVGPHFLTGGHWSKT